MRQNRVLGKLSTDERQFVEQRVAYYNRLQEKHTILHSQTIGDYQFPFWQRRRFTTYFFDLYDVLKYFHPRLHFLFTPGDVTLVPHQPTFVKSRPIHGDNRNAVLLKLNKFRHFTLTKHDKPFQKKKDMLVARTTWANASPQRRRLCEQFWNHPLCNVGKTRLEENDDLPQTVKPYLSRRQQLEYKFIACTEGVDVASNLKWVMSSNSIAVSPPMQYETWFMEGTLIPDYHYIEVRPDFSDLIEKLEYYIAHPDEAEDIIRHAHEHVKLFTDKRIERATQLIVARKYFNLTNS